MSLKLRKRERGAGEKEDRVCARAYPCVRISTSAG
jgi:hypothetical protein